MKAFLFFLLFLSLVLVAEDSIFKKSEALEDGDILKRLNSYLFQTEFKAGKTGFYYNEDRIIKSIGDLKKVATDNYEIFSSEARKLRIYIQYENINKIPKIIKNVVVNDMSFSLNTFHFFKVRKDYYISEVNYCKTPFSLFSKKNDDYSHYCHYVTKKSCDLILRNTNKDISKAIAFLEKKDGKQKTKEYKDMILKVCPKDEDTYENVMNFKKLFPVKEIKKIKLDRTLLAGISSEEYVISTLYYCQGLKLRESTSAPKTKDKKVDKTKKVRSK